MPFKIVTSYLYRQYGKRGLDILLSGVGLVVLSPVLVCIALAVRVTSAGPILFSHERVGQYGNPFFVLKFRSMVVDVSGPEITRAGDARITPLGRILRRTKLDELPQLWNVLEGDMSLVGPRPEVRKYVDLFSDAYQGILMLKPGITDYAAVFFRDEETLLAQSENPEFMYINKILPEKIRYYQTYLARVSFVSDLNILFRTILKIF